MLRSLPQRPGRTGQTGQNDDPDEDIAEVLPAGRFKPHVFEQVELLTLRVVEYFLGPGVVNGLPSGP